MKHQFTIYTKSKTGKGTKHTKTGWTYKDKNIKVFQNYIRLVAQEHIEIPFLEEVKIIVTFYFQRPGKLRKTKPNPVYWHRKRGDLDNLLNSVFDGLQGVAYLDDGQVCDCHLKKFYCGEDDLRPRIELIISDELSEDEIESLIFINKKLPKTKKQQTLEV